MKKITSNIIYAALKHSKTIVSQLAIRLNAFCKNFLRFQKIKYALDYSSVCVLFVFIVTRNCFNFSFLKLM